MRGGEHGSNKNRQLMIMPGKGVRERFTEKVVRIESGRKSRAVYSKGAIYSLFHSFNTYLSSTCFGSGHPGAGDKDERSGWCYSADRRDTGPRAHSRDCKMAQPLWKTFCRFLKTFNRERP